MKIAIGADHRGYHYKEYLKKWADKYCKSVFEWIDVGTYNTTRTDYPLYVAPVISLFTTGIIDRAVLLCGSGVGMAIAANRHSGIYAAVVWNKGVVYAAREQDNSNVLVIPVDFVTKRVAVELITEWLKIPFHGEQYKKRLLMIDKL